MRRSTFAAAFCVIATLSVAASAEPTSATSSSSGAVRETFRFDLPQLWLPAHGTGPQSFTTCAIDAGGDEGVTVYLPSLDDSPRMAGGACLFDFGNVGVDSTGFGTPSMLHSEPGMLSKSQSLTLAGPGDADSNLRWVPRILNPSPRISSWGVSLALRGNL